MVRRFRSRDARSFVEQKYKFYFRRRRIAEAKDQQRGQGGRNKWDRTGNSVEEGRHVIRFPSGNKQPLLLAARHERQA